MIDSVTEVRDTTGLVAAMEAVLFTLNRAVSVLELQDILQAPLADVEAAAAALTDALEGRGLFLQRHQDQLQLATDPSQADVVRRVLRPEYPSRLSPAAYETLAIIAYRQPLTRAQIEETGRLDAPGTPRLFGSTMKFLQILGLRSLEDLPPLPQSGSTSS